MYFCFKLFNTGDSSQTGDKPRSHYLTSFSPQCFHLVFMWANRCDGVNNASFQLQSSTDLQKIKLKKEHPPKHDSWPTFVFEVWGVWGGKTQQQTEGGVEAILLLDWCAVRNIYVGFSDVHEGKYMEVRFRGWEVSAFWHERQRFDKPGAPSGKRCLQLQRLAVSHGESDGAQTQHDGFVCPEHERLQSNRETQWPRLPFPLPEDEFCFGGQRNRSVVCTKPGSSPRCGCFESRAYKLRGAIALSISSSAGIRGKYSVLTATTLIWKLELQVTLQIQVCCFMQSTWKTFSSHFFFLICFCPFILYFCFRSFLTL